MNNQIKELAKQAEQYAIDMANHDDDEYDWPFSDRFREKFAELIIKECARIIETRAPGQLGKEYGGWTNGFDDGLNTSAFLIKKHFGVE